jgi:uncharacterized protein YndB with AHSA1/START domain
VWIEELVMTKQKDLKRVVRTRMRKTGESYTAARVHVLARRGAGATKPAAPASSAPPVDYAALAGMSDETIAAKTGCTWKKWVGHLDHIGAADKSHREIAAHVHEKFGVPGWWAQMVTVGYERIRGLREIGQRLDGDYEASKSKTFAVPVERLFEAFTDPDARARWLPGVKLTVRKATPGKSIRITWEDDTPVEVWLQSKDAGKSVAAIAHRKLKDRARAEELKRYWGERLAALSAELAGDSA